MDNEKLSKEKLESWYEKRMDISQNITEKEKESVCEFCGGEGEIETDEDDGEGHIMVGVGTQKCVCQIREEEYDDQDK